MGEGGLINDNDLQCNILRPVRLMYLFLPYPLGVIYHPPTPPTTPPPQKILNKLTISLV